jgi:hypothetical protein
MRMMSKGMPFRDVEADVGSIPTFSEAFLYKRVGKGDARFMLGVAEEYDHVIAALGPDAVRTILAVRPRLAQRLGIGQKVIEWLGDATADESRLPAQVILDAEAAEALWAMLHREYCRHYDPERSLPKDMLRAYNMLTDGLGEHEQRRRQKERDRLPEKLQQQEQRRAQVEARKRLRHLQEHLVAAAASGEPVDVKALADALVESGTVRAPTEVEG